MSHSEKNVLGITIKNFIIGGFSLGVLVAMVVGAVTIWQQSTTAEELRTQTGILREVANLERTSVVSTPGPTQTVIAQRVAGLELTLQVLGASPDTSPTEVMQPTPTISSPTISPTIQPSATPISMIISTFDGDDLDGWRASKSSLSNPGLGGNTTNDETDGHLRASNSGDNFISYFIAPKSYHGDWRSFSVLKFDLWSAEGRDITSAKYGIFGYLGDVYLVNGPFEARRLLDHRPSNEWETFVIPLEDDGQWIYGAGTMRLEDILLNVTDFQIRAEWGTGNDFSGLDNVQLVP